MAAANSVNALSSRRHTPLTSTRDALSSPVDVPSAARTGRRSGSSIRMRRYPSSVGSRTRSSRSMTMFSSNPTGRRIPARDAT